jgi:Cof subfamily protein (haloacid dehalogenase superfamily)
MPHYRLLALDIDGTLVNSDHELTSATRDAVRMAKAAGIEVVLATGRRYSRTLPLVEPLGIEVPLVTASGALVKHPHDHQTLFRAEFSTGTLTRMLATIAAAGYDAVMYGDTFHLGFDYYVPTLQTKQSELVEYFEMNPDCERVWPQLMTAPPAELFAGFVMGSREQMLALESELSASCPGELSTHVLRSPRYRGFMCEVAPAGVSKWTGVWHLAEQRGIMADEICAVGDDVNDISMIQAAGLGVAMDNAVDELKAVADRIAPCNNSDGLTTVIDWILE